MNENQKPEIHTTNPNKNSNPNRGEGSSAENDLNKPVELHIEEKPEDHFILNLKNFDLNIPEAKDPTHEVKQKAKTVYKKTKAFSQSIPKPDLNKLKKVSKSTSQKPKSKLVENVKFVFNTFLIFIITFVALNWGSYKQVFLTHYLQLTGQTSETLNVFSEQTQDPNSPTAYASSPLVKDSLTIPSLNKEVTPPGTRIIIPSINTNVPVVDVPEDKLIERNWTALENEIQNALRSGVVHYPGTPLPGESGNVVITGHSSYYPWDPGRFKDVFAVLHNLSPGDEIIIFHRQQKYTYQVTETSKVFPYEVDVLNDYNDDRLTLITCTPIGTNLKRLIITAKPV